MKLLFLDIETSPNLVYTWGLHNQNLNVEQVITPSGILCFAAKWAGNKEIIYESSQNYAPSEKYMIRRAHKLLSEADAICHYNGNSFDIPRLNQEFLRHELTPPPTVPQIDLLKVVQGKFSMTSSKLAFVGPYLKIGDKVKNAGWSLWRGCLEGNKECWRQMREYNQQDVVLLEKLYKRLLPWIDNHPNMNLYSKDDKPLCPNCGSNKLQRNGFRRATTYIYQRYQCQACGHWSRTRCRDKTEPVATRV